MDKQKNNDIIVIFILMYVVLYFFFALLDVLMAIGFIVGIYFIGGFYICYKKILWKKQ